MLSGESGPIEVDLKEELSEPLLLACHERSPARSGSSLWHRDTGLMCKGKPRHRPPTPHVDFHANTGCSSSSTGSWRPSRHSHRNCSSTAPVGAWMNDSPDEFARPDAGSPGW